MTQKRTQLSRPLGCLPHAKMTQTDYLRARTGRFGPLILYGRNMSLSSTSIYVVGAWGKHFHRDPDCWRIRTGQTGKNPRPIRQLTFAELIPRHAPCRTCYPDAPRTKVHTPYCHTCESVRPCAHNGGVLVKIPRVWRYGAALLEPGQVTYARRYVWPHRAARYVQV
jgi:hypothetical protein